MKSFFTKKHIRGIWWTTDKWILLSAIVLILVGCVFVLFASQSVAINHNWTESFFIKKHVIFAFAAFIVICTISLMRPKTIIPLSFVVSTFLLICIIATFFIGDQIKGAGRWINIFGFSFQPSEIIKPWIVVITARILVSKKQNKVLILSCTYIPICLLLLTQPDFGMTILILSTLLAQILISGIRVFWVGVGVSGIALISVVAYFSLSHVQKRIDTILFPNSKDKTFDEGFQMSQSIKAFKNGGLFGVGPDGGKFKESLPDAHSDFIFSVIGEEFGTLVCLLVLLIYLLMFRRCMKNIAISRDMFSILSISGLTVSIGLQAVFNVMSAIGLLPPKGMSLPFLSYGGSSMLSSAVTIGFILAIVRKIREDSISN